MLNYSSTIKEINTIPIFLENKKELGELNRQFWSNLCTFVQCRMTTPDITLITKEELVSEKVVFISSLPKEKKYSDIDVKFENPFLFFFNPKNIINKSFLDWESIESTNEGYLIFRNEILHYLYSNEPVKTSVTINDFISDKINSCLVKGYEFITPISIIIEPEEDYFICYDRNTNLYGTGETVEKAKIDYCESLIDRFEFLKENKEKLFIGYKKLFEYLNKIVIKK